MYIIAQVGWISLFASVCWWYYIVSCISCNLPWIQVAFVTVAYRIAGQTTKGSKIYKHIIYIFILRRRRVWSRNTFRESLHISFFCGGDPLCVLELRPENIHDMFAWVTHVTLPLLEWLVDLSPSLKEPVFSPKLQTLYHLSSPKGKYEHPLCLMYFLFMAGYRNLHTSGFFFLVICWSYLRTEISVTIHRQ